MWVVARSGMSWSPAISSASRATGIGLSPVVPDSDPGAPPVDASVGKEEFTAHYDLKVAGAADPVRMSDLPNCDGTSRWLARRDLSVGSAMKCST